jgi:hypothetical protein
MIRRFGFKLGDHLLDLTPLQSAYYLHLANRIAEREEEAVEEAVEEAEKKTKRG